MPSGRTRPTDSISKGDTVRVVGGACLAGQSGIAMEDNYGRNGMVSVQFEGYPKPRRIEASRLQVTKHDPNSPQVQVPTYPNPVSKPPLVRIQPATIDMQGVPLTREMFEEAHRAIVLQRMPGESDAHYKARIATEIRKIKRIHTSKEKALATRQALVRDFPAQEDRDAEEAIIHTRAHRFAEMRKARLTAAFWG